MSDDPRELDAIVIGSGPNGLAAAVALARAGLAVHVVEARDELGGGTRTSELTIPGFLHDVCSTAHPTGAVSPWFRTLELEAHGLEWVRSPAAVAHVLPDGRAITLEALEATIAQLGDDGDAYRDLMAPYLDRFDELLPMLLAPLRVPRHPWLFAKFGMDAMRSLTGLARARFTGEAAPALLAGIAAHTLVPLDQLATASVGLVLALIGHAHGWPLARGGSRAISDALARLFTSLGGTIELGHEVRSLAELPPARAYLFDTSPRQLAAIAGDRLPARYRARLLAFRHAPGVFKIDWALHGPVPWRDPRCARAATVHLSGTLDDVAAAEAATFAGRVADPPFTLVVQPSLFDPTRAPAGKHVAWAYGHVPAGSTADATARIEAHIERFAPGFRDLVIARATLGPEDLEAYNANYVGGDITGGLGDLTQLLFRPVVRADPYATPARELYLCSASTPPGAGVHGMCGYWAAASVLRRVFGKPPPHCGAPR
ncbi:MAG: NAD(P)/FAD-dependent oxidoreductase [Kofleriaceae bacterium]